VSASSGAVDVEADLTLSVDGAAVTVRGYGDRVVVEAPSLSALRSVGDVLRDLPAGGRGAVADVVGRADVAVDVRVRGASVARLGPGARAGALSRLAGVDPARVSVGGVVLAALRRFRGRGRGGRP
jgi:hypothetical protein